MRRRLPGFTSIGTLFPFTTLFRADAEDEDETGSSIAGTPGNDNRAGTEQGDTLAGGDGDDTLTGGGGADVFSFSLAGNQGNDVITDFTTGSGGDTLQFSDVAEGRQSVV